MESCMLRPCGPSARTSRTRPVTPVPYRGAPRERPRKTGISCLAVPGGPSGRVPHRLWVPAPYPRSPSAASILPSAAPTPSSAQLAQEWSPVSPPPLAAVPVQALRRPTPHHNPGAKDPSSGHRHRHGGPSPGHPRQLALRDRWIKGGPRRRRWCPPIQGHTLGTLPTRARPPSSWRHISASVQGRWWTPRRRWRR